MKKHLKTLLVCSISAVLVTGSISSFAADPARIPASDYLSSLAPGESSALPVSEKTDRFELLLGSSDKPADQTAQDNATAKQPAGDTGDTAAVDEARFSMISADGQLIIHVIDQTEITYADGKAVREALDGRKLSQLLHGRTLTVSYSVTTRSLPPQTTPSKIVVLDEQILTNPAGEGPSETSSISGGLLVLGEQLVDPAKADSAAKPYMKDGVMMLPMRAVAEKLGFTVRWEAATKSIMLGNSISLSAGKNYYTVGRMAPITLSAAPEIVNGLTYVPMDFFQEVVKGYNVTAAADGSVTIVKSPASLVKE